MRGWRANRTGGRDSRIVPRHFARHDARGPAGAERCVAVADVSRDGLLLVDAHDRISMMNARMTALLGCEAGALLGVSVFDIVRDVDREALRGRVAGRAAAADGPIDVRLISRDGAEIWATVAPIPIQVRGRFDALVLTAIDNSEQRKFELSLYDSEDRFSAFMNASSASAWMKDEEERFVYVNDAWETSIGVRRDHALGKTAADLLGPERAALVQAVDRRVLSGDAPLEAIEERDPLGRGDGTWQTVRFLFWNASGQRFTGGIALDITSRRRAEEVLRATEARLRGAQKMEALGKLAGGVAHDFNNMLSVILSSAEMILAHGDVGAEVRCDVEEIRAAGLRAADLTHQLLAFSRGQATAPAWLDLGEVLRGLSGMLRRLVGADIEIVVKYGDDLGPVWADPGGLGQVVMNLVVNARDAMPNGGALTIETRNLEVPATASPTAASVPPGSYVALTVIDTGTGMDEATRSRIFEPFFTTKDVGKGTGLGLATVFRIVEQCRGVVRVDSKLGAGTRFEVLLPRTTGQLAEAATSQAQGSP
jgi:two-component system cell cycle sensor histidine kinase/response regulator CckA